MPTTTQQTPEVRHEEFCLPRPEATEPRLERYFHLKDDEKTGRSRPSHDVTRCLECGATNYKSLENTNA